MNETCYNFHLRHLEILRWSKEGSKFRQSRHRRKSRQAGNKRGGLIFGAAEGWAGRQKDPLV